MKEKIKLIIKEASYIMLFLDSYKKYVRCIFIVFAFPLIAYQTLPNLFFWYTAGLDPSWVIGINVASIEKMQFGKDIVFTFGPLGFLYLPAFCQFNTWIISMFFALFVHCLFLYSIYAMIRKLSLNIPDLIVMVIVLIFALPVTSIEYRLLFSLSALFYLVITNEKYPRYDYFICILICFLMAVVSLIKFTAVIISLNILLFMTVYYIYRKKYIYLPMIFGTYTGSILLLLYMTGQKLSNFPAYILNSIEISSGYNSAMSLNGPAKEVLAGLCVLGLLLIILVDSIFKHKKDLAFLILLNAGFIFVSFKHGFVRHDAHVYSFFGNMLIMLMIIALTLKKESRAVLQHSSFVLICILIGFIYSQYPHYLTPKIKQKYQNICSAVSLLKADSQGRAEILDKMKSKMRETYGLDKNTLEYIDNKSINMIPWEIALPYAYNMNWSPMPVFQSYSAYTPKLDLLNAAYFEKNTSPEILLYSIQAIDGRYNLFDTPETFRTILNNYKPVFIYKRLLLLEKRNAPNPASQEIISTIDVNIGESIQIPDIDNEFVFAKIYMDYNLAGKIFNILYKAPEASIKLKSGEKEYNHRFIFSNARNGIFLSQYITNEEELKNIWNNKPLNNLNSFTISVENERFYNKKIHIEFFKIKL